MSGPREDFLDALNYQVKEEVINNYFRERLILEEELREYDERLLAYREIERETRAVRDYLACLLVNRSNFLEFFQRLGFTRPPLARLGEPDTGHPAACPLELNPRGFTRRGRYLSLTFQVYGRFHELASQGRKAAAELLSLAGEVNSDIRSFHMNFDLMSIVHFLRNMDQDALLKKHYTGENFTAAELGSLEESLRFRTVDPAAAGLRSWPELPDAREARNLAGNFVGEVFRRERGNLPPVLS